MDAYIRLLKVLRTEIWNTLTALYITGTLVNVPSCSRTELYRHIQWSLKYFNKTQYFVSNRSKRVV